MQTSDRRVHANGCEAMKKLGPAAGFTYVALLFMIATISVGLAVTGSNWHTSRQREKEAELLFIGEEFRRAIALYYYRTPGGVFEYPNTLEELLEDKRFPTTQRYLRKIYRDPMTNRAEWGLILSPQGRVIGVRSLSDKQPLRNANFPGAWSFGGSKRYADWEFVFVPTATQPASRAP